MDPVERRQPIQVAITQTGLLIDSSDLASDPAIVHFPDHLYVEFLLNGERVIGRKRLMATDSMEVRLRDKPGHREAHVTFGEGRLEAHLHLLYEDGAKYQLVPMSPAPVVEVKIEEIAMPIQRFERSEVDEILADERICVNVDDESIEALLASLDSGTCRCASGNPPVQGVREHYELLVVEPPVILIGIVPIKPVMSVFKGAHVAQHVPRQEGEPGLDVTGKEIPPDTLVSKLPQLGKGLTENEDGLVSASRSGRVIQTARLLDVAETLVIEGSHRAADGHIVFDGDVVIRGDVEEGVEILAGGRVHVGGHVSAATIVADEGITVIGGVFQAILRAGTRVPAMLVLIDLMERFMAEFAAFVGAARELSLAVQSRGLTYPLSQVATTLLQDRFQNFRRWPTTFSDWLRDYGPSIGAPWTDFVEYLVTETQYGRVTSVRELSYWEQLSRSVEKRLQQVRLNQEAHADIQVKSGQNANFEATGDILCSGQGFYQCTLKTGAKLQTAGMLMGCQVTAELGVVAKEIGSQVEVQTWIDLGEKNSAVKAGIIHAGTMMTLGPWKHRVMKTLTNTMWP